MADLLESAVPYVLAFVFIGMLIGAGAIAMTGLVDSITVSNEWFNGTSGSAATLSQSDIVKVNSFQLATATTSKNDTMATGNNSSVINLNDNFINSQNYSNLAYNLTVIVNLQNESVQASMIDSCNGNYTLANGTNTFVGFSATCLSDPLTVSIVSNSTIYANTTNLTNVSATYFYWADSTAYTIGSDGSLTPSASGVFRMSYAYGSVASNSLEGLGNFSAQMPSIGTVAGVALIVIVLFLALGGYLLVKGQ